MIFNRIFIKLIVLYVQKAGHSLSETARGCSGSAAESNSPSETGSNRSADSTTVGECGSNADIGVNNNTLKQSGGHGKSS